MHELPLLINISVAIVVAFFGGLLARRIGLPTIVGYLLAGIAIGPFTPGFVGDIETIRQLAELGVIFLMFGVGLHFSFADLWKVRDVAVPGALGQTAAATLAGFGLSQLWGWPASAGIVLGLAISVASTVVLLRGLMDHSLLNTPHGQVAVGWLVMEDILSVLILVVMPALAPQEGDFSWSQVGLTLVKAGVFAAIMFFIGVRLIPWLLERIAHTRSRELFILAVLAVTLGTAIGAAELFGVSLALGAFVAGAIVSQSHLSHQVGADVLPFREAFAALFFVSIGMLVNPIFLWQNAGRVLALTGLIVGWKGLVTILLGLVLPRPARTFLVVAVGLSQIGEFSFILGQAGMALGMLDANQYALILAGAIVSITLNPLMFALLPKLEALLQRSPVVWDRLNKHRPAPPVPEPMTDHVVITGYGQVGKHLVDVLESLKIPHLVIEANIERVEELGRRGVATLYGEAANSEIITHAGLERARALVVTLPDEATNALVASAARDINPKLPVIARAASVEGVAYLARMGATRVVHPELEGGLEMVHDTLLTLGYPLREVHEYAEAVRRDHYNLAELSDEEHQSLHDLLLAFEAIDIAWLTLPEGSPLAGVTLAEANLRARTGASVVALIRNGRLTPNPKSGTVFEAGDRIGFIGEKDQIEAAEKVIRGEEQLIED